MPHASGIVATPSPSSPVVVALAGPSGSGKSLLACRVREALGLSSCVVVPVDHFYRDFSALPRAERVEINFDDPAVLDTEEIARVLDALIAGRTAEAPIYDFTTHARAPHGERLQPAPLILVEGIFALHLDVVRERARHQWFLELDAEACLRRRIDRDVRERGRSEEEVRWRFERWVRPSMERFVMPQRHRASRVFDGRRPLGETVASCLGALGVAPPAGA